ncbi:unnamed protein product, partial [Mesorhabditis spiculigera]
MPARSETDAGYEFVCMYSVFHNNVDLSYSMTIRDIPRASNVKRGDALSSSLMGLNLHEEAERLLPKDFTSVPYIKHHMDLLLDLIANHPNGDQFFLQYGHLPFIEFAGPRSWRTCYYAGYDIGEYEQAKSQHPSGMMLFRCVSTKKRGQQNVDMVCFGLVAEVLSSLAIFDENGNEQPHHIGCLDFYVIKTWIGDLEVLLCVQGDGFVRSDDGRHQIVELKCSVLVRCGNWGRLLGELSPIPAETACLPHHEKPSLFFAMQ